MVEWGAAFNPARLDSQLLLLIGVVLRKSTKLIKGIISGEPVFGEGQGTLRGHV